MQNRACIDIFRGNKLKAHSVSKRNLKFYFTQSKTFEILFYPIKNELLNTKRNDHQGRVHTGALKQKR